jgi:hypothetical protein
MNLNIKTKEPPRFVIKELYKIDLPIKGGWGYSINDACIIDKTDKSVIQGPPFDGVSVEYVFIEKRNYAELINTHYSKEVYRKTDKYYAHIECKLIKQRCFSEDGKRYDHLEFEIECVPKEIFDKLSELAKDPDKLDEVWKIHEKEKLIFEREYFFDITSFYGRNK